jgi:hypothetical protein
MLVGCSVMYRPAQATPAAQAAPPAAPPAPKTPTPDPSSPAPVDPYEPAVSPPRDPAATRSDPAPEPAAGDAKEARLNEEIAFAVAQRAQELLDARQYADAKQLAIEAAARSPRGVAAERAGLIIRAANTGLGIPNVPDADASPQRPSTADPAPPVPSVPAAAAAPAPSPSAPTDLPSPRLYAMMHSGLYGGLLGATIGGIADDSVGVEVAAGAAGAAAGALLLPRLLRRLDVEQVRTVGSASLWGGVVGGLLADVTTSLTDTSPRQVLLGATLGSSVAVVGGYVLARDSSLTRGDVALVDTLASMGAIGGLTVGLTLQPVESEGYSLNAAIGASTGVVLALLAAPQTNTTPRRMSRVAAAAAAGAAAPWLGYALFADDGSNNDEQVAGLISTLGLLAGGYLGLLWTANLDVGKDVHGRGQQRADDAPAALLRRSSTGELALGGMSLRTSLQAPQPAYFVDVVAGRF